MPVYEYRCSDCSNEFDEFFHSSRIEQETKVKCNKCGSENTTKLLSLGGNFSLKGSGWTPKSNRDSTGSLRDQTAMAKQDLKDIANKDLYKNTPAPINVKD